MMAASEFKTMPALGQEPFLHPDTVVRRSRLGAFVEIGEGTHVLESELGDYSYTARYADIAYSFLGKFVNVAAFARINPGEHPYHRASLHHFMYRSSYYWPEESDEAFVFDWRRSRPVRIGHDTWIGHASVIMKGVTIGNGAIVAAKSVVTKDVPPYAVVGGTPAKVIKWRHPPGLVERLEALAWWNWDHQRLRQALPDFRALSAEAFVGKYERENTDAVMRPLHSVG
jgi:phosphonate metabolism protein (transferase hexapeptide repeat family)